MSFTVPSTLTTHTGDGGGGGLSDGDYGDISVSGSGTVLTIDNSSVEEDDLNLSDNTTADVSTSKHGFVPKAPNDATKFLDGTGAFDTVKDSDLSLSDVATNNSSTSNHGFLKKLDNSTSNFMRGDGSWAVPAGTGASAAQAARIPWYLPWTSLSSDDDEFDNQSFSGWTSVTNATPVTTQTEDNDVLSISHPGSDAASQLHAWVKSKTINSNDWVEAWLGMPITAANSTTASLGVIMANGNTYGAGAQVGAWINTNTTSNFGFGNYTNYNTSGTITANTIKPAVIHSMGIRLQYLGSNNWAAFMSSDGVTWINMTGTFSRTMTPTHAGFFVSSWNTASNLMFFFRYCRFSS